MPVSTPGTRSFSAPLGEVTRGALVFARGVSNVSVRVDPALVGLFEARFEGEIPEVSIEDGVIEVSFERFTLRDVLGGLFGAGKEHSRGEVVLNPALPWGLESRGGVNRLEAHLEGARIESVRVGGGANHVTLDLPAPAGAVPVTLGGGTNHLAIGRPAGVSVRLEIGGGANRVDLDGQRIRAAGGGASLASRDGGAAGRYEVRIGGGANHVSISERGGGEPAATWV